MSKERKNMIVPKLRFPEFRNDGEWEEKRLGEIGEPLMCKRIFKEQTTANPQNAIPFYKIGTFGREADSYISIDLYNDYKSKYSFPTEGDILISASGTIGRLVVYDGADAYFQDSNIVWLKNNEKSILNSFLFYCYSILRWQTSDGGVIQRLYNSDLKNIKIRYPQDLSEQQKIASCLSSLDDLITAENQKLEALKAHKKGLMQQLFPVNGQITPILRFAEFKESGEWEEKKLGEIGEFIGGGTPSKSNESFWEGDFPWISSSDILEDSIQEFTVTRFITNEAIQQSATKKVPEGSILIVSRVGVGKLAVTNKSVCTSQDFTNFIPEKDNAIFLAYYLKANTKTLLSFSQGMAIKGFTKDDISNLELFLPKIEEQQKIASCLSSLDEFITSQAEKIEGLKEHKKGLMQGLFPKG
jgi:type I restriction enzyme S subunit